MGTTELKLVIFGWRGVLWDNLGLEFKSILEIFHTYGLPMPKRSAYTKGRGGDFAEFCYANGLPRYVPRERIAEIRRRVATQHPEFLNIHRGAREILATCGNLGLKTAIVSAELTEIIEERIWQFEIYEFVNLVRGGAKDKERILLEVLKFFGVEPAEAMFVEDTFDGLIVAKKIGIRTTGVTYGHNSKETILKASPDFPNPTFGKTASLGDIRRLIRKFKMAGGAK